MFGQLNEWEIEEVLTQQLLGRIGWYDDGQTFIVPICYAYQDGYIYARTYEGMKLKAMRKNPHVCFEVESIITMVNWKTVLCQGRYEELTDINERNRGIKILHDRVLPIIENQTLMDSPHWPFSSSNISEDNIEGIVFRLHLTAKTGRFEREGSEENTIYRKTFFPTD